MKHTFTRIAGIALFAAGVAGIVFCLVALIGLGSMQGRVESAVLENLAIVDRALSATADALDVAEATLDQATALVDTLSTTMADLSQTVVDTVPTVEALVRFLGVDLPAAIRSTQDTLRSAASTAKVIDDILAVVTAIPLLGTDRYNPEVPLYQGLAEVADNLDRIPDSLSRAEEGLIVTTADLQVVGQDFDRLAGDIAGAAATLHQVQPVLAEYQQVVSDLQALVNRVEQHLPGWLGALRLGLSLLLLWLGIAQIGLITQGWELIGRSRGGEPAPH